MDELESMLYQVARLLHCKFNSIILHFSVVNFYKLQLVVNFFWDLCFCELHHFLESLVT